MTPEARIKDLRQAERDCGHVLQQRGLSQVDRQDLQHRLNRIQRQIAMLTEAERERAAS